MPMPLLSRSRGILVGSLAMLLCLVVGFPAEAQLRVQSGASERGKPQKRKRAVRPVLPQAIIKGAIGAIGKSDDEGKRRKHSRRPRPGTLTDKKPVKPRCGVRGRPPCPGKTAEDADCRKDRRGRWHCKDRPPSGGRGRPPVIVLPEPAPGDRGPPPPAYAKREERAPQGPAAASDISVPRQVLVLVAASQPDTIEGEIGQAYGLQPVSNAAVPLIEARAQVYRIDDQRPVEAVIATLSADARVMMAQRNLVYHRQSGAGGAARAAQYGLDMIGAPRAHEIATGRGVKIAVIDSGIDREHSDLEGAVSEAFDATDSKDPKPDVHGTAIAGIIRARGLVSGVAPDAELLAARAFYAVPKRELPESTSFIILRALDWAVRHGAQVINLSFSGRRDAVIERALGAAVERNAILVAAAGNGGPKAAPSYPAAYAGVIAVTAHDSADRVYVHANHGKYISVAAPGVDILVPVLKNGHMFMSGTSMAAAYVSGIMALLLEKVPQLRPEDALRVLAETAEDLGRAGRDESFGAGRVQARAALDALIDRAKAVGAR